MSGRTCASCGAVVGVLVDRCPSCGADPDVRLIELGGEPGRRLRRADRPAVRDRPRPPARSWRRWAPVGVTAAVVWAAFVVTADDPAGEADQAIAAPTPTEAGSTAPDRSPGTTTTLVVPGAPLLGETVGFEVAFISDSTRIVDLDSGVLRTLPRVEVVAVTDAGLLVSAPELAVWPAPYDGSGAIVLAEPGIQQAWVTGNGRQVWSVRWPFDESARAEVLLHDLAGGAASTFSLPPVGWPAGVAGDSLVLGAPGGTYLLAPDGAIGRISSGEIVTSGGGWLVVRACDERLACELQVIDSSGRVRRTHPEFATPDQSGPIGPGPGPGMVPAIASDGRLAALRSDGADGFVLTVDGEDVAPLLEPGAMAWSPDGRWLLVMDGLELVSIDTSRPIEPIRVDLQLRARAIWAVVTFPSPS